MNIHQHKILILDFGSQYTQLIARRVREIGVYCELMPYDVDPQCIRDFNPNGIILSGGPESVHANNAPKLPAIVFELNLPLLGICYGMQAMANHFGGKVESSETQEFGFAEVEILDNKTLFKNLSDRKIDDKDLLDVWMSHGDKVVEAPNDFIVTAKTKSCPIAAMRHQAKAYYGLQFHPEVTHSKQGKAILQTFMVDVCNCECNWTSENIIDATVKEIQNTVGEDKVLLALSGGVDSSVTAMLLNKAIGDNLTCVFVDNGLLRLNEAEQVMDLFAEHLQVNVKCVDAKEQFYTALKGVDDPEQKRKIAGEQFIRVFEREAKALSDIKWLGQGTIYPDVIESAAAKSGKAHVIKSHHNVGGLPEDMKLKLVEPLRELFKDEVRKIGLALGLPKDLLYRHPFPGPGLTVRILGEIKPEYVAILQRADAIFIEELRRHELYDKTSQAFAVFLPVKSVGVKGDQRVFEYVIALRAVETIDFMTAKWAHLPYEFLELVSNRMMNEIREVARVAYDISGKPPSTIEWE